MHWLETLGISALLSVAVTALASGYLKYLFEKKLELSKHENQTKLELSKQEHQKKLEDYKVHWSSRQQRVIEKLKASLSKRATEHEVRYKKLHERMAEILDELFQKLERSYYHICNYASDLEPGNAPTKEEQYKTTRQCNAELSDHIRRNALFIPDAIESTVTDYLVRVRNITRALKRTMEMEEVSTNGPVNYELIEEDIGRLGVIYTRIRKQVQKLLGINQSNRL